MKWHIALFLFYQNEFLSILWGDEMALCPADMPSRLGGGDHRINEV